MKQLLFLAALLLTGCDSAPETLRRHLVVVVADSAPIRDDMTTEGQVIKTAIKGDSLELRRISGELAQVSPTEPGTRFNSYNKTGYVSISALAIPDSTLALAKAGKLR